MRTIKLLFIIIFVAATLLFIGANDSSAELTVYDADGQLLGVLIDRESTDTITIYLQSLDVIGGLNINDGFLEDNIRTTMFFESFDCSGTPYIQPIATYYLLWNNDTFYMGEKVAPISINYNSKSFGDCRLESRSKDLVPAEEAIPPFSLPVALPLIIEHEPAHPGKWKK